MDTLEILHLVVTSILVGIIWIIQMVHYPSFRFVSRENFDPFHRHHTSSITPIVAPAMVIELSLVIYICYREFSIINLTQLTFVLIVWISTFLIQVPIHNKLAEVFSQELVEKLIKTNWVRTILWTAKLLMMIYLSTYISSI